MKKRNLVFFTVLFFLMKVKAQFSLIEQNFRQVPQVYQWNPAFIPEYKFYFGTIFTSAPIAYVPVPLLNSFYFNKGTPGPLIKDFFSRQGDSVILNPQWDKKAKKMNYSHYNLEIGILSFGFRLKQTQYFHFYSALKSHTWFGFPRDFISLLLYGNAGSNLNKNLNLGVKFNHNTWMEHGFSYAREIKQDKLWAGGTFKIYTGIANVQTKRNNTTWRTADTAYEYNATSDILVNAASVVDTGYISGRDKSLDFRSAFKPGRMFKNLGIGIDLGVNYVINNKFSVNASVNDIGFIRYRTHLRNYSFKGDLYFPGIDIKPFIGDSVDYEKAIDKVLDSLAEKYKFEQTTHRYTVWMPTRTNIQGWFHINEKNKFSLTIQNVFYDKKPRFGFSLGYVLRPSSWFSLSLAYQIYNRSYSNLGAGLVLNLAFMQWYVMTNNLFGFFHYTTFESSSSSFTYLSNRNINLRTGCNWTFGRKPRDRDKDGIIDKKDLCPDIFGLAVFQGCPDRDNDSIPDKDDHCPSVFGVKYLQGCPDRDGDKITDTLDACPDDPGLAEFNGCPDRDGDKIIDKEDECPDEPGLAEFKGCPDKDGDKIPDREDACPDDPGLAEFKGCPDKDGDKIIDKEDDCPEEFGLAEFKGCPDKDGDKIMDKEDKCPEVPGVKEYKGCPPPPPPKMTEKEKKILQRAFSNLEFETGKDIIRKKSYPSLNELAQLMISHPDWILTLSGHTDNQGTPEFNLVLSEKRAKSVKRYLVGKGASEANIITEWFGDTRPIADNKTPQGRQKNRRVEMKVTYKEE